MKRTLLQEKSELESIINAQPADTKDFFRNEVAMAIGDIRDEYDSMAVQAKHDTESWYRLKV